MNVEVQCLRESLRGGCEVQCLRESLQTVWRLFNVLPSGEAAETGVAGTRTPVDALLGAALMIVSQQRSEHLEPLAALLLLHEAQNSASHDTQPSLAREPADGLEGSNKRKNNH